MFNERMNPTVSNVQCKNFRYLTGNFFSVETLTGSFSSVETPPPKNKMGEGLWEPFFSIRIVFINVIGSNQKMLMPNFQASEFDKCC